MSKYSGLVSCVLAMSLLGCESQVDAFLAEGDAKAKAAAEADAKAEAKAPDSGKSGVVLVAGLAAAALAGGSSAKSTQPPPPSAETFNGRLNSMTTVSQKTRYRVGPGIPSPGAVAPASGRATYAGNANLRTVLASSDHFAVGKMELTADFEQNTFSGRISDFLDPADRSLSGTITISNGVITNEDQQTYPYSDDRVSADLGGNIYVNGVDTSVTGTLSGGFREGQQPEPISPLGPGYLNGNINLNSATPLPLYGSFTTTRQ